ncbi:MAG TPA: arylsulfatase [Gemmataceae bacterium]|nr:arylsulfatase [Gemmataceae bacterium]
MFRFCTAFAFFIFAIARLPAADKPNIVFLLADDLGYGDLGCYGQKKIRTPNIDGLAGRGMRFTNFYAGSNVCAPSRCCLMTGKHPGHGYIRENKAVQPEGQEPVPADYLQFPLTMQKLGYTIGGFGKWGLGPVGSTGDPLQQGFARFYGYNCQGVAHNYYPTHLWDNEKHIELRNPKFSAHQKLPADADLDDAASYARYKGVDYAPDLITEQALAFLRAYKDRPFFLYFPTTIPHLALQVPDDSLKEYAEKFPEKPYVGDKDYLPHRQPHAAYAAMITRLDGYVGRIIALVRELGLEEKTIFVFTSDNGPLWDRYGGTDSEFFNSAGGLRGHKGGYHEAGFREPCIVSWKGVIKPGTISDRVCGFEDWFPTILELIGAKDAIPGKIDGISFASTLLDKEQPAREFLYRESPGSGGQQCVRVGDWKAIRLNLNPDPKAAKQTPGDIELYDLKNDPNETTNVAKDHPDIVAKMAEIMKREHVPSKLFPLRAIDGK